MLGGALDGALDELNAFRAREGAEIGAEMRAHNARVAAVAEEMERIRVGRRGGVSGAAVGALKELLKGAQIDPQRLAQEAAILADRSDIGEELARLKIHSAQLGGLLDAGGEVGKKLDFLLAGDESRDQHDSFEDQRRGRSGAEDHGAGARSQGGDREDPRADLLNLE